MNKHQPELGQALFGQPHQIYGCPAFIVHVLEVISNTWEQFHRDEPNPFSNSGYRYNGVKFSVHAYSWNEEENQEWNFKWRDVRISWYKWCGRGTTMNRRIRQEEAHEMLIECMAEIKANKIV
jgi:hypothetical protein